MDSPYFFCQARTSESPRRASTSPGSAARIALYSLSPPAASPENDNALARPNRASRFSGDAASTARNAAAAPG
ncbi:MAG: hypothetical protein H6Q82_2984 [Deltaproteobacteria bacterium]|nr:hypothetical protein [Deltaproteobacteria bacterium]